MSNPQEEVYKEYLNYDWESFSEFKEGLQQILDAQLEQMKEQDPSVVSIPPLDKQQLIDQAKSFFFCSHTGNILNLEDYNEWRLHNGSKFDKSAKIVELEDLAKIVEIEGLTRDGKIDDLQLEPAEPVSGSSEPPYSSNYQQLVDLIVSGKPVPGIKHIPDTVLPEQSSKPGAEQRAKPWEKSS